MKPQILQSLKITQVNWLPVVRAFIERIELQSTVDRLVPGETAGSASQVVMGLVMDALSGRMPLFRLQEFFPVEDRETLFGREIPAEIFSDRHVGHVLDKLFESGTPKIFSEIAQKAVQVFEIDSSHLHSGIMSVSLYGDADWMDPPPQSEQGGREKKKIAPHQFLVSILCFEDNIPIFCKPEDGEASDKTIHSRLLPEISRLMTRHELGEGHSVYVADSALITGPNLEKMAGLRFLGRMPASFPERGRVVREAVEADQWIEIGALSQSEASAKRPATHYQAHESNVSIDGKTYRAIVIHSSDHDKRRQKPIDRAVEKERKKLEKLARDIQANPFSCRADAEREAARLSRPGTYHRVRAEIREIPRFGRGRPAKHQPRVPSRIDYGITLRVEPDPEKLKGSRMEAGCFVLITNIPETDAAFGSAKALLSLYKDQTGVKRSFGFLNDPAVVNAGFLNSPARVEALGLILVIAQLIWRLIERTLRRYVEETGETLPGWDGKQTARPTAFMMTTKLNHIFVIKINGQRGLANPLTPQQLDYLKALGLTPRVFTDP